MTLEVVCIASEVDVTPTGGLIAYHKYALPPVGHKEFYKTRQSSAAFFHSMKARNHTKTKQFTYQHEDEFEKITRKSAFFEEAPIIEHASLWDFYKYIGYDFKTKKFKEG